MMFLVRFWKSLEKSGIDKDELIELERTNEYNV